jgi:hypothetical protein
VSDVAVAVRKNACSQMTSCVGRVCGQLDTINANFTREVYATEFPERWNCTRGKKLKGIRHLHPAWCGNFVLKLRFLLVASTYYSYHSEVLISVSPHLAAKGWYQVLDYRSTRLQLPWYLYTGFDIK